MRQKGCIAWCSNGQLEQGLGCTFFPTSACGVSGVAHAGGSEGCAAAVPRSPGRRSARQGHDRCVQSTCTSAARAALAAIMAS